MSDPLPRRCSCMTGGVDLCPSDGPVGRPRHLDDRLPRRRHAVLGGSGVEPRGRSDVRADRSGRHGSVRVNRLGQLARDVTGSIPRGRPLVRADPTHHVVTSRPGTARADATDDWAPVDHWLETEPDHRAAVGVDPRLLRIGAVGLVGVLMIPVALAPARGRRRRAARRRRERRHHRRAAGRRAGDDDGDDPADRRPASSAGCRAPPATTRARSPRPQRSSASRTSRRAPARTPSSPTTSGTASRRRPAHRSRSGSPPTTPRRTRRSTSATSCASRPAPRRPRRRRPPAPRPR